jgi:hypothetical protein
MTTVSTVKNITVAYNPNDFYYMNAKTSEGAPAKNATNGTSSTHKGYCDVKKSDDDKIVCKQNKNGNWIISKNGNNVDSNNFIYETYLGNCYDKALCINEDNQVKINNLQLKHDGADERHGDINIYYNRELLKSYNLGIGIIGVGIMIYFFYK